MTMTAILQSVGALIFVLCLIMGVALILRRLQGEKGLLKVDGHEKRLKIIERLTLTPKHRIYLVSRDQDEYTLLLSGDNVQVLSRPQRKRDVKPVKK